MGIEKLPQIAAAAIAAEKKTGCPAALMAAQCIIETGWLASAPGNNCFGIKSYSGEFGRQLLCTTEWFTSAEQARFLALGDGRTCTINATHSPDFKGRRRCTVQDWFATFATLGDCFARRGALFTVGRYAAAATAYKLNGDFTALVRTIAPIYATDPHYADTVLTIAHQKNVQDALKAAA